MKKLVSFEPSVYTLRNLALSFDPNSQQDLLHNLQLIKKLKHFNLVHLATLQADLLFIKTHASHPKMLEACEAAIKAISQYLKKLGSNQKEKIKDTFLPFSSTSLIFSYTLIKWLSTQNDCRISFDGLEADSSQLNSLLKISLPNPEKDLCSIGYAALDLFKALKIKKGKELEFILQAFDSLQDSPHTKDHLWDSLKIWVKIESEKPSFSRLSNRFDRESYFYHDSILKRFEPRELIERKLPAATQLRRSEQIQLIEVIRKAMVHTMRETDPATYMQEDSLRWYNLERGISIALFDVVAERQLPYQSYIGYTLFKNGYPMAYGGSWIIGEKAHFGINIFDAFRGGESGFVMCQLLRTYVQLFNLKSIEVDAYQFGKNNEDGIKSAAFWFYYKFGFEPIDKSLKKLAAYEYSKIKKTPSYKTKASTLRALAESNVILHIGECNQLDYAKVTAQITKTIANKFSGNRSLAIVQSKKSMPIKLEAPLGFNPKNLIAFDEFSLLWIAFEKQLEHYTITEFLTLIQLKTKDYVAYQAGLAKLLKELAQKST